jgi:hypothetical protein
VDRTFDEYAAHIDTSRTHLNQHLSDGYTSSSEALRTRVDSLKMKQKGKTQDDEIVAAEVILTASSEYFEEKFKGWQDDASILQPWIDAQIKFAGEEWADDLVSIDLHLDELTPHFHIYLVPTAMSKDGKERRISYGSKFTDTFKTIAKSRAAGGSTDDTKLGALQTRYAQAMQHLELKRGIRKSAKKHMTPRQYRDLKSGKITVPVEQILAENELLKRENLSLKDALERATIREDEVIKMLEKTTDVTPEQLKIVKEFTARREAGIKENPSVEVLHAVDALLVSNARDELKEKAKNAQAEFMKNVAQLDAQLNASLDTNLVLNRAVKQSEKPSDSDANYLVPGR